MRAAWRLLGCVGAAGLWLAAALPPAGAAARIASAPPSGPSAIGPASVSWIAVAPDFAASGLVVAVGHPLAGCQGSACGSGLWVSHDGGASWSEATATGWGGSRPAIVADRSGRDVLFDNGRYGVVRSDDDGQTWRPVGPSGYVDPSPAFASTQAVAVAGSHDYLLQGTRTKAVAGSGGALVDISFMLSPRWPSSGAVGPAALLSAADKHSGVPVVQRCNAALACTGGASLPGSATFAEPVSLLPSSDFVSDGVVFAQAGRAVYKSADGGASFTPLAVPPPDGASATATPMMSLAPGYREAGPVRSVYVAVLQAFIDTSHPGNTHSAGGIYRSTDGGTSWSSVGSPSPLDGGATAVAAAPGGRIFAGYLSSGSGGGLLCSADGTTWTATCPAVGNGAAGTAGGTGHSGSAGRGSTDGGGTTTDGSTGGGGTSTGGGGTGGAARQAGASTPGHGGGTSAAAKLAGSGHRGGNGGAWWALAAGLGVAALAAVGGVLFWRRRRATAQAL